MRRKKRYSIRGKMMRVNIGIILTALVLCGGIFAVSVFRIVGNYIHHDINFFLTTMTENMEDKLEYCEDVIYALRDSNEIEAWLKRAEKDDVSDAGIVQIFARIVDISTSANLGNGNIPIAEEIYLFDDIGNALNTEYYAMLTSEKEKSRQQFKAVYEKFKQQQKEGKVGSYAYYRKKEGYIYLVFSLYNDNMDVMGETIYKISENALHGMMQEIEGYQDSFWAVCDKNGNFISGRPEKVFLENGEEILAEYHNQPYSDKVDGREYRIYRKEICMNAQVLIGIPENQAMILMYDSARIYIFLIAVITGLGCTFSFVLVYRLTRPIGEITDKLKEVKEGDFETKLPEYDSTEFHEISETFNEMTAHINHLIKQVYEKQISIKDMELKFLQTQMNPHFMFNVLNTIALQAKINQNEDIYKMISSFSRLIQAKIYRNGKEKIKIGQELEYVEYYLYLQSYRFGEHLQYEIKVEEESLKELYLPKLCMQLIVENAVVHGIEPKVEGGHVKVNIFAKDNAVYIEITDDGMGFVRDGEILLPLEAEDSDQIHNHVGLNNAHHIIQMMYGEMYGIYVLSKKGQGTMVRVNIPFDKGGEWDSENE